MTASNGRSANSQHESARGRGAWLCSRSGAAFLGFLVIAGFFLVTEHTAHVFGALPSLLLVTCLFLHFFMHGGHGKHGGPDGHSGHGR